MPLLRAVPLTLLALLLYGFAALFAYQHCDFIAEPGAVGLHPFWDQTAIEAQLPSGQIFALTYGGGLVLVALILLLLSILRAAGGEPSLAANMVAAVVLGAAVVAFMVLPHAGTMTFLLLTAITLVEAIAVISIALFQRSRGDAEAR